MVQIHDIPLMIVAVTQNDTIVGCAVPRFVRSGECSASFEFQCTGFGPFAVSPDLQRRGVGTAILDAVETRCRHRGAMHVNISVINHRSDLLSFYSNRGFVESGTAPT